MLPANQQLDWADAENDAPDSGVWASPQHEAFPLVHRVAPSQGDLRYVNFFSAPPIVHDTFDDLVDDQVEAIWHARRYRRAAVKTLAALAFGAVCAVAVLAGRENPHARSAVTDWATLGAAR